MAKPSTNKVPQQVTGTFQPPPPGAPQQTAEALSASAVAQMQERAAQNERPLPPFNPQPTGPIPPAASSAASAADAGAPQSAHTTDAPPESPASAAPPTVSAAEALSAQPRRLPAESDTDSPSRGIPRAVADPGKQITGGFGSIGEQLYFALDGTELRAVAERLAEDLIQRLQTDLRFSIAITYPRVSVTLQLTVAGYAEDAGFTVETAHTDGRTPIEVARERAAQVVFVLEEGRREFDPEGNPENPPDRLRDELGLLKPQKQFVNTGPNRMIVDVPSRIGDAF